MFYFGLAVHIVFYILLGLGYYFFVYDQLVLSTDVEVLVYQSDFHLSIGMIIGISVLFEVLFLIFWKKFKMNGSFLTSMKHMDYLGKMVMNNKMYVEKNVQGRNGKSKRKIVYFPKIYYKRKNGYITVRFPTDLQKDQDKFLKMEANLEHAFFGDMVEIVNEQDFVRYKLLYAPEKARLNVPDVQIKEGKVPLMKEYDWNYIKFPHALVSGVTGGGKSVFMMYILKEFVEMGFDCDICDFKRSDMSYFEVIPSFRGKVFDTQDGIAMCIREFREDMDKRKNKLKELSKGQAGLDYRDFDMKPRVLFFDEYVAFLSALDFKEQEKIMKNLQQIVLLGRQLGFYLVMGMQRPDASFLPNGMRDQFGLRVSLGAMSQQGYAMMYGDTDKAFKKQPDEVKAWGYAIAGDANVHQFFAPFMPEGYDFVATVAELLGESPVASEAEPEPVGVAEGEEHKSEA
uniref:hypothetical protein n=1 Tax=Tetragenococcus halophilus TaxID=51669 RepID=UPI0024E103AA|nr:hypothetical protein [Tetragenococcus halophilus]